MTIGQLLTLKPNARLATIAGLKPKVRLALAHLATLAAQRHMETVARYQSLAVELTDRAIPHD